MEETVNDLGHECIESVLKLQMNLRAKESKIGNHFRMNIRNCMDALTTSPVESSNNSLKNGRYAINSNMHLNKSVKRMLDGINDRLSRKRHKAQRDINKKPLWSLSHTGEVLINKAEGLLISEFDARHSIKSVQINPTTFLTWNFDSYIEDGDEQIKSSVFQAYLPHFVRVREVSINNVDGHSFVRCSCMKWKKLGNVCRCFARVVDNGSVTENEMVSPGMVDVRHWKMYAAHYGEQDDSGNFTDMAQSLFKAQALCVKNEDNGIPISNTLRDKIVGSDMVEYPILGPNTTQEDYKEMCKVRELKCCTFVKLMNLRILEKSLEDSDEDDELILKQLQGRPMVHERQAMTATTKMYQDSITNSDKVVKSNDDKSFRANCVSMIDNVDKCPVGTNEQKEEFRKSIAEAHKKYFEKVKPKMMEKDEEEKKRRGDNSDRHRLEVVGVGGDGRAAKKTRNRGVVYFRSNKK